MEVIPLIVIAVVAGWIRGCIGFGFSALMVMWGTLFMPIHYVVPIAILLEIACSLQIIPAIRKEIPWGFIKPQITGIMIGTPLGVLLMVYLPLPLIKGIISCVVLLLSLALLRRWLMTKSESLPTLVLIGVAAGIAQGTAGLAGLVVAVYLMAIEKPLREIRAYLAVLFLFTEIVHIISGLPHGLYHWGIFQYALIIWPFMAIGLWFGNKGFARINEHVLRRRVLYFLIFLSLIGLAQAIIS